MQHPVRQKLHRIFISNFSLSFRLILRTFLVSARKVPKEADLRGASSKCAPLGIPSRIAIQHSKMFRFLNACILQTCKFVPQSPLKIGTFSVGGGQRGGSGVRGEGAFARNASPRTTSLVTFLFGHKKVTHIFSAIN